MTAPMLTTSEPNVHPTAVGVTFRDPICKQGHDKRRVGITKAKQCKECATRRAREEQAAKRANVPPPERVPALRPLREGRGHGLNELAFEAGLDPSLLSKLERGRRLATYEQRIAIYRALSVLSARDEERREAEAQRRERMAKAGLS